MIACTSHHVPHAPVCPPWYPPQKYRLYLKKIGGYTPQERVDSDALQALHEHNVAQMAAQQAAQEAAGGAPSPDPYGALGEAW